jgi:glucosamine--fructose-6-phosphate aminotransferase (isomerizing)
MCGIVGHVGTEQAAPILIDGLKRLEYRGYDSAGVAVHVEGGDDQGRPRGRQAAEPRGALAEAPLAGSVGIGHTRWATHGRPSEVNAHPHVAGPIAVVHNGIIENHLALRARARGARRQDRERHRHRARRAPRAEEAQGGLDLEGAVRAALRECTAPTPSQCSRRTSPTGSSWREVVAAGPRPRRRRDVSAASDIPALLPYTREMIFLEDGDMAVLTREGSDQPHRPARRSSAPRTSTGRRHGREGGLQALHAQGDPRAAARHRGHAAWPPRSRERRRARARDRPERRRREGDQARVPARVRHEPPRGDDGPLLPRAAREDPDDRRARERVPRPRPGHGRRRSRHRREPVGRDDRHARRGARGQGAGAKVLAIANVIGSAIPRLADAAFYTHAGPEIGVASTKCFTTQLANLRCSRSGSAAPRHARRRAARASSSRPREAARARCATWSSADATAVRTSPSATATRATCSSSAAVCPSRSRSRARSSSRRSRTCTPRATRRAR